MAILIAGIVRGRKWGFELPSRRHGGDCRLSRAQVPLGHHPTQADCVLDESAMTKVRSNIGVIKAGDVSHGLFPFGERESGPAKRLDAAGKVLAVCDQQECGVPDFGLGLNLATKCLSLNLRPEPRTFCRVHARRSN
jgi:hypothetical protein